MAYILREGLAFCFVNRRPVFLDIGRDRYFLLRPQHEQVFLKLVEGRQAARSVEQNDVERLLGLAEPIQPIGHDLIQCEAAMRPLETFDPGRTSLMLTARAAFDQSSFGRRLRRQTLSAILGQLALLGGPACVLDTRERRIIAAHRKAGLLRTARGRCLETSLALASALRKIGCSPNIVIGVALSPFRAHCWLQHGNVVLNDHPDHVRAFTPILVL